MMAKLNFRTRFFNNGFVKIILGVIICVSVFILSQIGAAFILGATRLTKEIAQFIASAIAAIAVVITYKYLYQALEKRQVHELSTRHLTRDMLLGLSIGTLLQTLTIGVIYLNKGYHIVSVNKLADIIPWMGLSLSAAIVEEIVFRGIIFRITEERLGSYWALAISSALFGAAHFFNPAATVLSSLSIAVEAGLLLGGAYMLSRNILLAVAIHFAWDFVQAGIYGVTTSGSEAGKSLITSRISGPEIITGRKLGPEVSIQATVFCLLAAFMMLIIIYRGQGFINPYRKSLNVSNTEPTK
jgi:membrane protease YdiL (CAAX protease family)